MDSILVNMKYPYYLPDRELFNTLVERLINNIDRSTKYVVVSIGVALRFMYGLNNFFNDDKHEGNSYLSGELTLIGSIFGVDIYVDPYLNFHHNEIKFYDYENN